MLSGNDDVDLDFAESKDGCFTEGIRKYAIAPGNAGRLLLRRPVPVMFLRQLAEEFLQVLLLYAVAACRLVTRQASSAPKALVGVSRRTTSNGSSDSLM